MKVIWIHGVSRLRGPSMSKWVKYLYPEVAKKAADFNLIIDEIKGIPTPILRGIVNRYILYSFHVLGLHASLFHIHDHANAHLITLLPRHTPKILNVYDLYMMELPISNLKTLPFHLFNVPGLLSADHLITISLHMKEEITARLSYPADKISVIYCGIDHSLYKPQDDGEEILRQYGIAKDARYILFVGSEIPRKNFDSVLKVFKRLLKTHPDLILLKIGSPGPKKARINSWRKINELGLENKVTFCGFVPEEHLPYFYSNAQILAAPSYYEGGSGMHVIEAMACGCPVVTSNIPQVREYTGNAVIYCNPYNADDIFEKMATLLEDTGLRGEMASRGLEKAREFSWERSAMEHLSIYRQYME